MKKLVSILLVLMLTLAAVSALADAPKSLDGVEGLPELPEIPTMKTKRIGNIQTVTLSGKLDWLQGVQNWNMIDLEWSEDGLTGSFDASTLKNQVGYGQYINWDTVTGPVGNWMFVKPSDETWLQVGEGYVFYDEETYQNYYVPAGSDEAYPTVYYWSEAEMDVPATEYVKGVDWTNYHAKTKFFVKKYEPGYVLNYPVDESYNYVYSENYQRVKPWLWLHQPKVTTAEDRRAADLDQDWEDGVIWDKVDAYWDEAQEKLADVIESGLFDEENLIDWNGQYADAWVDWDGRVELWATTERMHFGLYDTCAYMGGINGYQVQYDRAGNLISAEIEVPGANFFGGETAPEKTVVTYARDINSVGAPIYYIKNITETYADGSQAKATYAMNGKLISLN